MARLLSSQDEERRKRSTVIAPFCRTVFEYFWSILESGWKAKRLQQVGGGGVTAEVLAKSMTLISELINSTPFNGLLLVGEMLHLARGLLTYIHCCIGRFEEMRDVFERRSDARRMFSVHRDARQELTDKRGLNDGNC